MFRHLILKLFSSDDIRIYIYMYKSQLTSISTYFSISLCAIQPKKSFDHDNETVLKIIISTLFNWSNVIFVILSLGCCEYLCIKKLVDKMSKIHFVIELHSLLIISSVFYIRLFLYLSVCIDSCNRIFNLFYQADDWNFPHMVKNIDFFRNHIN